MLKNILRPPPILYPMIKSKSVKRITSILLALCSVLLMISGCEKEESKSRKLLSLQIGCSPEVFSVPGGYCDSIYYADNKISRIDKYYLNNSERNTQSRFEYSGNEVKIFVRDFYCGYWRDVIYYKLSFEDGKISQVVTNSSKVSANYYYEESNLKYILYHRNSQLSDSISVEYYGNGSNIMRASWFQFDQTINNYALVNTVYYTYDDKNNPYKNSIHFLYDFYDCEEFSLDYFNMNNLKTIKSADYELHTDYIYNDDIHADYIYNDNNYPISITFYNGLNQVTDRNSITYNCR